jgi:septum site-determining protein MinC
MSPLPVDLKILDYRLPTVRIFSPDEDAVVDRLAMMIEQRPALFKGMDVAMNYAEELPEEFDQKMIEEFLAAHGVNVVARTTGEGNVLAFTASAKNQQSTPDEVVSKSLRSGQRIYSKGSVVILGSVSSGAEVLSEGSIHVYGELHGRALAGVQGDRNAAIFTQSMDAELVSVAGVYRTGDQLDEGSKGNACRVMLDGDSLSFQSINQ